MKYDRHCLLVMFSLAAAGACDPENPKLPNKAQREFPAPYTVPESPSRDMPPVYIVPGTLPKFDAAPLPGNPTPDASSPADRAPAPDGSMTATDGATTTPDAGATADSGMVVAPPFAELNTNIFRAQCYTACHENSAKKGGLRISGTAATTYANLTTTMGDCGMPYVVPGKPDDSLLIKKIDRVKYPMPPCGMPMPNGLPPLTAMEIAQVRAWIAAGAPAP